ncbi:hypothetical protein GLOIN_2v1847400 [Rhizophagus irregularis DAOM 181602=DAOM 197198]|uniref:Uncharacterized protein n=1 Tax=Rhizophagus irregularis (strain DAOM 181602 / DAOM 197198 / MUCL 43194) TaxID=747089 RepID=A0A2P4P5V9_RHIID|nr:hypothetical protein GLOIN_2v1847400 [Rhizophagus irregularis DAOM 181602=DAOM 197198]POG60772.1 hypothetical protein GLOIN_2v1847400 [Rhizophagus irregularis DAOM 181602=DAOM 197198]|eukprot:XP_025167638.1 hypothetical protein GLOIN_2v1847400 [Rhizophagus irregularis DAOM 181602=DAOM 197198]
MYKGLVHLECFGYPPLLEVWLPSMRKKYCISMSQAMSQTSVCGARPFGVTAAKVCVCPAEEVVQLLQYKFLTLNHVTSNRCIPERMLSLWVVKTEEINSRSVCKRLCGIHCTDIFVIMPDIFNDDRQYNYISTRTNPNITYNNIVIEQGYIGLRPIF